MAFLSPATWGWKSWATAIGGLLSTVVLLGSFAGALERLEPFYPVTRAHLELAQQNDVEARKQLQIGVRDLEVIALEGQINDRLGELLDLQLRQQDSNDPILEQYKRRLKAEIRTLEMQRNRSVCTRWQLVFDNLPCPNNPDSVLEDLN